MFLVESPELPQPEHPVIDPTRERLGNTLESDPLEARLSSFRRSYPHAEAHNGSPYSGEVWDCRGYQDSLVYADTDRGIIARNDQEVVTDKMVGCATLLIQGPDSKALVHLTPSSRLPYRERADHSVAKVVEALKVLGHPLNQYRLTILANIGLESSKFSKFSYDRLAKLWEELRQKFIEAGLGETRVQELPLDETVVYHSPKRPDEVFVMGRRNCYDEEGNYREYPRQIDSYWVPLAGDQPFDFGLHLRPPKALAA